MSKYVLATNNPGKVDEIKLILGGGRELLTMAEAGVRGEADETGDSFRENALIKARYALAQCGLPSIADDSGLVVDALGGDPGVHSARYAEPGKRKLTLLKNMEGEKNRAARFVSVVACVFPEGSEIIAEGVCEGEITLAPAGTNGFGYDPIFYVPEYRMTFAELDIETKNLISHRGKAFRELERLLRQQEPLG